MRRKADDIDKFKKMLSEGSLANTRAETNRESKGLVFTILVSNYRLAKPERRQAVSCYGFMESLGALRREHSDDIPCFTNSQVGTLVPFFCFTNHLCTFCHIPRLAQRSIVPMHASPHLRVN